MNAKTKTRAKSTFNAKNAIGRRIQKAKTPQALKALRPAEKVAAIRELVKGRPAAEVAASTKRSTPGGAGPIRGKPRGSASHGRAGLVAGQDTGSSYRVRPRTVGTTSKPGGHVVTYHDAETQQRSVSVHRHDSLTAYKRAVGSMRTSVGLAGSDIFAGAQFHEYEGFREGQRLMRFTGREYLGVVGAVSATAGAITWVVGDRMGVFPIAPNALGGRPKLFAETFEMFKFRKLRVVYASVVPAITPGAIAIYYYNDPSESGLATGTGNLQHASSYQAFVQTPVWETVGLDIDPQTLIRAFDDTGTADAMFAIQGAIVVVAASAFTTGDTQPVNMGNLFIEYELEFRGEALHPDVTSIDQLGVIFTGNATTGACQAGRPLFAAAAAETGCFLSSYPFTASDMGKWYVGVVQDVEGEMTLGEWHCEQEPGASSIRKGQAIFGVVREVDISNTPKYYMFFVNSLAALDEAMGAVSSAHTPNTMTWASDLTFTSATGTMQVYFRIIPIDS